MGTGGSFLGGKAGEAWSWPLTSSYSRGQENVDLNIHSTIRLYSVVLIYLIRWTTLYLLWRLKEVSDEHKHTHTHSPSTSPSNSFSPYSVQWSEQCEDFNQTSRGQQCKLSILNFSTCVKTPKYTGIQFILTFSTQIIFIGEEFYSGVVNCK
jgi:hypothetical protein